ncbi:MAG: RlmE family RNA methyltransferase [Burkholderiales bacterium]
MAKSSKAWLKRHVTDSYVRQARAAGYRSRAAYKLLEIDQKDRILRPGSRVLDLGAAPGGWSQVAAHKVGPNGRVVAIDLLEIAPISGVEVLKGDVREAQARAAARQALGGAADLVLSDLSPNLSGIAAVDQARAAELAGLAVELACEVLKPSGALVVKVFQGEAFEEVRSLARRVFHTVAVRKPGASRGESRETYLLGRGPKRALE